MFIKKLRLFFTLFIVFFSCSKEKVNFDEINHKICQLQQKTAKTSKDSMSYYLSETKKLFYQNTTIPDSLRAENDFLTGRYFKKYKNIDSAFFYFNKTLKYSKDSIKSKREIYYFLNISERYFKKIDYLNGLNTIDKLDSLLKNRNDYQTLADINNYKDRVYDRLKNYKKSLSFNKKAIKMYALDKDTLNLINNLIHQSKILYLNLNNKDTAYQLLDSIKTLKWSGFYLKYSFYKQIGVFKFYDQNYVDAYKNYLKSLVHIKQTPYKADYNEIGYTYLDITEVLLKLKKYTLAKKYYDSTKIYSKFFIKENKLFYLQNKLHLSFYTNKEFESILVDFNEYAKESNKIYEERINHKLIALQEANLKEKELLIINQNIKLKIVTYKKNQLILFSVLGLLILLSLVGILFYRQKKLQTSKNEILMQQRLFRAQMNPHFTSNVLFSIQSLFKTDMTIANEYLVKFSRLLRLNLENSIQNYVSIEKELEAVEKYLALQTLRFPNTFNYKIEGNCINDDLLFIPPMLIQPFVENAIKHGFSNINYKGFINIKLNLKNNFIFCEIEDNGVGVNKNSSKNDKQSTSTQLIKQLIKKLTKKDVMIHSKNDTKNSTGTSVQFYIPLK